MNKKILVVVESIDIEDSSGTKGRVALIKNLFDAGYNLRVYHYTLKDIQIEGVPCFRIKENRNSLLFYLSRIERNLRRKTGIKLNPIIEKYFGFSFTLLNDRNSIINSLRQINDFNPDLVLTLSKGGSFRPHHAILKMDYLHSKWMAYIHDPYPMHLYPAPYRWYEPGYNIKEKFVKEMFEKAKYLAFPSKLLKEWMGGFFQTVMEKSVIIPHQISGGQRKNIEIPNYFDKTKFTILHAGHLLKGRDPQGIINAFNEFLGDIPEAKNDARLIFLGGRNYYTNELNNFSRENPQIYVSEDYVPYTKVSVMQDHASVNIILETKAEISPFLPGKFPHCIMANKPILLLGPYRSESRRLLGDDYEYWSEIDDVESIKNKIIDLYKNWKATKSFEISRPDLLYYMKGKSLHQTLFSIFER
ncbi:UDP-glycosyltransferase [Christiangramia echinicola]|uniref:UDP-glycosyltransferase n=1 Tax=Christiangramia echinicola TaxID=279359 RepID=UPI00041F38DF|nr:UDP-glycosyltransferase [Christiangramia echinicola]